MNNRYLKIAALTSAFVFSGTASAIEIKLDLGLFAAAGTFDLADGSTIVTAGSLYGAGTIGNAVDADHITATFDTMNFQVPNALDLNDPMAYEQIDGFSLNVAGTAIVRSNVNEMEGLGDSFSDNQLYVNFDTAIDDSFQILFYDFDFGDLTGDAAISTDDFIVVASGLITSSGASQILATLDANLAGFMLSGAGSNLDFSANPIDLQLTITNQNSGNDNVNIGQVIPEPSILALMGLGLVGFGVASRRRSKKA